MSIEMDLKVSESSFRGLVSSVESGDPGNEVEKLSMEFLALCGEGKIVIDPNPLVFRASARRGKGHAIVHVPMRDDFGRWDDLSDNGKMNLVRVMVDGVSYATDTVVDAHQLGENEETVRKILKLS